MSYRSQTRATVLGLAAVWGSGVLFGQPAGLSARDLFYERDAPKVGSANPALAGPAQDKGLATESVSSVSQIKPARKHLGLRYSLLKIVPATRQATAVDPDQNFAAGDCFAVEFTPNHDGHLYVFNRGSSGVWQLLLPSPQMPEEPAVVRAGATVRVPREYCFQIDGTPGVESLMATITEFPTDIDALQGAVRNADLRSTENARFRTAIHQVGTDLETWGGRQLTGRDIVIQKVGKNPERGEAPHAVYAVRTAMEAQARIVVEIKIRHE